VNDLFWRNEITLISSYGGSPADYAAALELIPDHWLLTPERCVRISYMTYRAVLFDLDGTLLDTLRDLADSANYVLAGSGFPQHEVEAYRYFVGSGMRVLASRALPEDLRDRQTVDKIASEIEDVYSRRWAEHTLPYPGIPELLDALTTLGIRMAILSNKPQRPAELMVSRLLPRWHFDIVEGERPGIPLKPDPSAALQIARRMKMNPGEFLYLGDSATDMRTAVAANMYPVGALWGFRTAEELLAGGAKTLIQCPADLLPLLRQ
jgi:phosphoglycolate phosphatase